MRWALVAAMLLMVPCRAGRNDDAISQPIMCSRRKQAWRCTPLLHFYTAFRHKYRSDASRWSLPRARRGYSKPAAARSPAKPSRARRQASVRAMLNYHIGVGDSALTRPTKDTSLIRRPPSHAGHDREWAPPRARGWPVVGVGRSDDLRHAFLLRGQPPLAHHASRRAGRLAPRCRSRRGECISIAAASAGAEASRFQPA